MTPDELRRLPGGSEPIPNNGSWDGSRIGYYTPGFVHPGVGNPDYIIEYDGAWLSPLSIALTVFTSLVLIIRITSRLMLRTMGVDDWLIIVATLNAIAVGIIVCLAAAYGGVGKHWYDISWAEMEYGSFHMIKVLSATYVSAIFFTKLSILFFLRRLFENTCRWMNRLIMVYIFVNSAFYIVGAICLTAMPTIAILCSLDGIHLSLEIAILILPMRMIWRLKMPLSQRIVTSLVLALGSVVCVISAVRLEFFATEYLRGGDFPFMNRKTYLYGILECTLGILTASAPSMKTAYTQSLVPRFEEFKTQWIARRNLSTNQLKLGSEVGNPRDRDCSFEARRVQHWDHIPEPERAYNRSGMSDEESETSYQELEVKIHTAIELGYWKWSGDWGWASDVESQRDVTSGEVPPRVV